MILLSRWRRLSIARKESQGEGSAMLPIKRALHVKGGTRKTVDMTLEEYPGARESRTV